MHEEGNYPFYGTYHFKWIVMMAVMETTDALFEILAGKGGGGRRKSRVYLPGNYTLQSPTFVSIHKIKTTLTIRIRAYSFFGVSD